MTIRREQHLNESITANQFPELNSLPARSNGVTGSEVTGFSIYSRFAGTSRVRTRQMTQPSHVLRFSDDSHENKNDKCELYSRGHCGDDCEGVDWVPMPTIHIVQNDSSNDHDAYQPVLPSPGSHRSLPNYNPPLSAGWAARRRCYAEWIVDEEFDHYSDHKSCLVIGKQFCMLASAQQGHMIVSVKDAVTTPTVPVTEDIKHKAAIHTNDEIAECYKTLIEKLWHLLSRFKKFLDCTTQHSQIQVLHIISNFLDAVSRPRTDGSGQSSRQLWQHNGAISSQQPAAEPKENVEKAIDDTYDKLLRVVTILNFDQLDDAVRELTQSSPLQHVSSQDLSQFMKEWTNLKEKRSNFINSKEMKTLADNARRRLSGDDAGSSDEQQIELKMTLRRNTYWDNKYRVQKFETTLNTFLGTQLVMSQQPSNNHTVRIVVEYFKHTKQTGRMVKLLNTCGQ